MNTLNHVAFIMDGNGRWGLKKKLKDKSISEDENKGFEKNIQKITDTNIDNIDKILAEKEKEILQI